ncbi:hypothetical protein TWF694_001231 [Orbilia ellipsospora]|uniref:Uncharacterized protein n=1 Tax=Orbilia ellipsospora TaxID=2528407 RepID=A0AAV9XSH4_9PEZI
MSQNTISSVNILPHDQLPQQSSTTTQPHLYPLGYNISRGRAPAFSDHARAQYVDVEGDSTEKEKSRTRILFNTIFTHDDSELQRTPQRVTASEGNKGNGNLISRMGSCTTYTRTADGTCIISNHQADKEAGVLGKLLSFETEEHQSPLLQHGEGGGVSLLGPYETPTPTPLESTRCSSSGSVANTPARFHEMEGYGISNDDPNSRLRNLGEQGLDGGSNRPRNPLGNFQAPSSKNVGGKGEANEYLSRYNMPGEKGVPRRVLEGLYDHSISVEGDRSRGVGSLKTYFSGVEERRRKESFWDDTDDEEKAENFDTGDTGRDVYHPKPTRAQMAEKLSQAAPDPQDKVNGWFSSQIPEEAPPETSIGESAGPSGIEEIIPSDLSEVWMSLNLMPHYPTNPTNTYLNAHKTQRPETEQAMYIDQGYYQTQQNILDRVISYHQAQSQAYSKAESSSQTIERPNFRISACDPSESGRWQQNIQNLERLELEKLESARLPEGRDLANETLGTANMEQKKHADRKDSRLNPTAPSFQSQFDPNFSSAALFYPVFPLEGKSKTVSQGLLTQSNNERDHSDITSPSKSSNILTSPTNLTDQIVDLDLIDYTPKNNRLTSPEQQEIFSRSLIRRQPERHDHEDGAPRTNYEGFIPESYSRVPPPAALTESTRRSPRMGFAQRGMRNRIRGEPSRHGLGTWPDVTERQRQAAFVFSAGPAERDGHISRGHTNERGWEQDGGTRRILQPGVPISLDSFVPSGHTQNQDDDDKDGMQQTSELLQDGYESPTSYMILLGFELGAEYEDLHTLFARRYGGDPHNHEAIQKAVLKDMKKYLIVLAKWVVTISEPPLNSNDAKAEMAKYFEKLKNGAEKYFTRTKPRIPRTSKLRRRYKLNHRFNKKLSRAERATEAEIAMMETSIGALGRSSLYYTKDKALMCEVYDDFEKLEERAEFLRKATKKVLKRIMKHRKWIAKLAEGGEDDMTAAEEVDDTDDMEEQIRRRGGTVMWGVDEAIEAAMKGGGALDLGFISSEDEGGEEGQIGVEEDDDFW